MKVAVITGTRADYGLLRPTITALDADAGFELALVVSSMHLQEIHGLTVREIETDGVPIAARVPAGGLFEQPGDLARHLGRAVGAFTEALAEITPDLVLVLGDRWEILAASLAATGLGIPISHLHGGELSEGSLDDAMRHCITKLAHLHFVATRAYAERVCQLGEDPARVHVVGAAGIESIRTLPLLDRDALARSLGLAELERPLISLTLHPASLTPEQAGRDAEAVAGAVDEVLGGWGTVIVTLPNDDPGNASVRDVLVTWVRSRTGAHAFASLGQLRYLSLLRHADAVVGNSSSALLEAPAFHLPAVNVGDRQLGRIKPPSVIDTGTDAAAVAAGLRRALDPGFRAALEDSPNPYGDGRVSERILAVLRGVADPAALRHKHFHDLPEGVWRASLALGTG